MTIEPLATTGTAQSEGLSMAGTTPEVRSAPPMSLRTLRTFFIATFVLSWGVGALFAAFPDRTEALFGPMGYTNPAY